MYWFRMKTYLRINTQFDLDSDLIPEFHCVEDMFLFLTLILNNERNPKEEYVDIFLVVTENNILNISVNSKLFCLAPRT